MFKEGNLVRLITKDGTGEVMRVLEDSDGDNGTTRCNTDWFDTNDLELIASGKDITKSVEQVPNVNSMTDLELVDQFNKYIIAVITSMRDAGCDDRVSISVNCEHYNGDDVEVKYDVFIKYGQTITTDNLGKSSHIALTRWQEDQTLAIKSIPFYVDKEAAE